MKYSIPDFGLDLSKQLFLIAGPCVIESRDHVFFMAAELKKITAACKLDSPPTSEAEAPEEGTAGKASGKVGAILPDTTSSTRYTLYDAPLLTKALKAQGEWRGDGSIPDYAQPGAKRQNP